MNFLETKKKIKESFDRIKIIAQKQDEYPLIHIVSKNEKIYIDANDNFQLFEHYCILYIKDSKVSVKILYQNIIEIEIV